MTDLKQLSAENARLRDALSELIETVERDNWSNTQTGFTLHVARAALSADPAPVVDAWQPIETAPKDGTEFQSWMRGSLVPVYVYYLSREYLETEYGDPDYMETGFYYSMGYPFDECLPEYPLDDYLTHWMPPAKPPAGENGND